MTEIEKMTVELLNEMDGMSPQNIEELRTEWIEQLKAGNAERYQRVEGFVNAVCDVAIDRTKKHAQVA